MGILHRFKRRLAEIVLQGRALDWWVSRKVKLLEHLYLAELAARPHPKETPRESAPAAPKKTPPKSLLFIGDIQWEDSELLPELEKICPVETLNLHPALQKAKGLRPEAEVVSHAIADFIQANQSLEPEAILFYAKSSLLSEEAFDLLRKKWNCPLLGMNLDDKIEFLDYKVFRNSGRENYRQWIGRFDLNLTSVLATVDWYRQLGATAYYMPEGFASRSDLPCPQSTEGFEHEISFVGSWRLERQALVNRLEELGIPVKLVGSGWKDGWGEDPASIYQASLMNLGLGFASPSQALTALKARDFECPGVGACYLTTYNWELSLHYEVGKEILCYRSVEELAEMFSHYRGRPEECLKIAQAAYRRCQAEHTWEKRFRKLFASEAWSG